MHTFFLDLWYVCEHQHKAVIDGGQLNEIVSDTEIYTHAISPAPVSVGVPLR